MGYYIFCYIMKRQGYKQYAEMANTFVIYAIVGTALGARLGHVFFYQWDYYSQHLLEILMVWKGGLASHGGVLGMIIAVILFMRKYGKVYNVSIWTFFDALIVPALLVSCCIRLGNFCNSEILGVQTQSEKGIVFCGEIYSGIHRLDSSTEKPKVKIERNGPAAAGLQPITCTFEFKNENERVASWLFSYMQHYADDNFRFDNHKIETHQADGRWQYSVACNGVLRHPSQLYEAMFYLLLFVIAMLVYRKLFLRTGLSLALFLGAIFLFRFFIEFIKIDQVEAESEMVLNIGQKLSIPVVIGCLCLAVWRYAVGKKQDA